MKDAGVFASDGHTQTGDRVSRDHARDLVAHGLATYINHAKDIRLTHDYLKTSAEPNAQGSAIERIALCGLHPVVGGLVRTETQPK